MIHDDEVNHVISADDQFLYAHNFARLYVVINIATSVSLQFLFPKATTFGNGVMLWDSIIEKLFGMTYKDAFEAAEKLRKWSIDPSKPLQHDIHNLMLLVKRSSERAKTFLPEESVLGMIYDAISTDPREELKMMFSYSSYNDQSLDEFSLTLQKSPHAGPFNSRHVKMNEFKPATIRYCNNFQEGKYRFGDKCRYENKINPDFKKKEVVNDDRKKNNNIITNKNNNKFKFKRKNFNNQYHNVSTGQPRNANLDGKPPKYSNQQQSPINNFNDTNVNSEDQSNSKNNSN